MRYVLVASLLLVVFACGKETANAPGTAQPAPEAKPSAEKVEAATVDSKKDGAKIEGAKPVNDGEAPSIAQASCGGNNGALAVDGELPAGGNCGAGALPNSPGTEKETARGTRHFGGDFTLEQTVSLASVLDKSEAFSGKNVKVRGAIEKVCKKKGCWFTVRAGEAESARFVRITMKDYGFFVPLDCDGKTAIVEGVFTEKIVEEPMRKHLATDGGDDPDKVQGTTKEFRLVATAIDIEG